MQVVFKGYTEKFGHSIPFGYRVSTIDSFLTINNTYVVMIESSTLLGTGEIVDCFLILCDDNLKRYIDSRCFIKLSEQRDKLIEELCK